MRIAAIGVGGAGGRIVDALYQDDESRSTSYLAGGCVLDTDQEALTALAAVPEDARHLFGHLETGGTGTDGEQALAERVIEDARIEMRRAADAAITSQTDAILLVAGLGGGTGGGATSNLADALQDVYDRPVYAASVLPATHEELPADNPARGLQSVNSVVDAQLVFDNEAWLRSDESIETIADELNHEFAQRLGALFSAGEATTPESVGQRVVDASEIIATLDEGGLATIGYARQTLDDEMDTDKSVIDRVRGLFTATDDTVDEIRAINVVETTLRRAAQGRLTFDCPLAAATSGLLVVAGPPNWLHQSAVADGQQWLADETESVQIRTGDAPTPNGTHLSILILFAGIQQTPRIDDLRTVDTEERP